MGFGIKVSPGSGNIQTQANVEWGFGGRLNLQLSLLLKRNAVCKPQLFGVGIQLEHVEQKVLLSGSNSKDFQSSLSDYIKAEKHCVLHMFRVPFEILTIRILL